VIIEGSNSDESEIIEETNDPSDAVAIAAIEADKEIKIAEIHADIEEARIEAQTEQTEVLAEQSNRDYDECRREIAALAETVERLEMLINSLTPPPVLEVVTTEPLETVTETNLTQPSTAAPTAEMLMEVSEENEEEKPEAVETSRVRKYIAI
jgi:hypothetical protein